MRSPKPPPHFPQYANLHGYHSNKHPGVFEDSFGGDLENPALDHPPPGKNYYSFQMGRPHHPSQLGHSRPNPIPPRVCLMNPSISINRNKGMNPNSQSNLYQLCRRRRSGFASRT